MKWLLMLVLFLASCTPVVSRRALDHAMVVTNRSGSFSCLGSTKPSCCYPYKHHRDIQGGAVMLCGTETVSPSHSIAGEIPISMIELHLRAVYDEAKPFEAE